MIKINKILKGLVVAASVASIAGSSVLAQDTTDITLTVTAGQLTVTSPATAAFTGITISGQVESTSTDINGINIVDQRGTNAGWTLQMKVSNLRLATPDPNDNILLARSTSALKTTNSADVYATITNSGLTDNSGGTGAPVADLQLIANPTFDTLSALDNTGETEFMDVVVAEVNEGAGDYVFNANVEIEVPPFGNYALAGKFIGGGDYTGTISFDFL